MRSICILLNNDCSYNLDGRFQDIIQTFSCNGYAFDEVRFLRRFDENKLKTTIENVKREYDNAVFLTSIRLYSTICTYFQDIYRCQPQGIGENAAFADGEKSAILLSEQNVGETVKNVCIPFLQKKYKAVFQQLVFRSIGANQAHINGLIAKAKTMDEGKMRYEISRDCAETVVRIFFEENVSKKVVDCVTRIFADGLQESLYAMEDVPLEKQLVELLKLRGKKLSVVESFTGGGIAKKITSISGASQVYFEGLNTYDERSKMKRLGVSEYTLRTFGAVSDNTAYEMAAGLIATGDCDVSIATTGLAGPKSDRSMLPIGLCYIAVGTKEKVFVYRYKFDGDRETITKTAIQYALFLAYKQVKNI